MESSTEESDSRTAAFSRKRKQPSSLNIEQYPSGPIDKRIKLENSYENNSHRRSSNESGDVSTSTSSTRRVSNDSATTPESYEAEDLDPERASRCGWRAINNSGASIDPFAGSHQPQPTSPGPGPGKPGIQTTGAKADAVFAKLKHPKGISKEDHRVIAQWLEINDSRLTKKAIQHSGLKARVIELMQANSLEEVPGVAKVLGVVSQGGDYSNRARSFLVERFAIVRTSGITVSGPDGSTQKPNTGAPGASKSAKSPDWGSVGLIKLDDIQNPSLKLKLQSPLKVSRKDSVEETLRPMVVNREPSFKQAVTFLTQFYQAHDITGLRLRIFQETAEQSLTIPEIERAMTSTRGFLRPLIRTHISRLTTVSTPVAECMDKSSNTSFATALLLHAKSGTVSGNSAKKFLENFIKINYVGGDQDSPIHSRIGLKDLLSSTTSIDRPGGAVDNGPEDPGHKLTTMGAAALTLDELEVFLPKPGNDPKERLAAKKAKDRQFVDNFWKRPNSISCLVAWQLLQLIKAGEALPNARENLNRFVEASNGLAGGNEELLDDQHIKEEDSTLNSLAKESLLPQTSLGTNTANVPQHVSTDGERTLPDIQQLLSDSSKFTRPLEQRDLVGDGAFVNMAIFMRKTLEIPLEEVVLHLANSDNHGSAARTTLHQYIEHCYFHSGPKAVFDYADLAHKATTGASTDSRPSSQNPAARASTDSMRSLADIEQMLRERQAFSRPMNSTDLVANETFTHMVNSMCKEQRMHIKDAVLYLTTDTGHAHAARMSLNQYINRCHLQARLNNASDHEADSHPVEPWDQYESVEHPDGHPIDSESLQRRYFHATYSNSPARCLSCGREAHAEASCPSNTCSHCWAVNDHFSSACPINQKCGRCRQRGHTTTTCTSLFSSLRQGLDPQCDICGRPGHVEEECSDLWRSSMDDSVSTIQIPLQAMRVSCYNCGASGHSAHWGDDCPSVNAFDRGVRNLNPTWSKKYADKYTQSPTVPEQRSAAGYGIVPSYQLAMLGDM